MIRKLFKIIFVNSICDEKKIKTRGLIDTEQVRWIIKEL